MPTKTRDSGEDQEGLRQINLSAVLTLLRQNAPISRTSLSELTSLNKATITRLVRELIERGLVHEIGYQSAATGRPSVLLQLDPEGGYIIGAGIEVDSCSVILANFGGQIIWRKDEIHSGKHNPISLSCITRLIQEANQRAEKLGKPILGMGVSAPGLVDSSRGVLYFAPNLGWTDVPIKETLSGHFSFPVYVDNEANMAAMGECYFGAARDCSYGLYIDITEGVGAGIVLNKQIFLGTSGLAGEVGHTTIDPNGPRCNCGNYGCWETYINAPAVLRRVRHALEAGQASILPQITGNGENITISTVISAAHKEDAVARQALLDTGVYIGIGLANLINAFNPGRVVLGGYLCGAYEIMLPEIHRIVRERALRWPREAAQIVTAEHGKDARLMGAIATVYNHILANPAKILRKEPTFGV